jgi:hypothetical protein
MTDENKLPVQAGGRHTGRPPYRPTICVDFDGVLYARTTPYEAARKTPNNPVKGAIKWLNQMAEQFDIVVFSCRAQRTYGKEAIVDWMIRHGVETDYLEAGFIKVQCDKVQAVLYIDDHGWRFDGHFPTAEQIKSLRTWDCQPAAPPHHTEPAQPGMDCTVMLKPARRASPRWTLREEVR